jgi:hypothetical protein
VCLETDGPKPQHILIVDISWQNVDSTRTTEKQCTTRVGIVCINVIIQ